MGTIYLKADLSGVTAENINQFNVNELERDEVEELIKAGHRHLLLQIPISTYVQYYLHDFSHLTIDECEQILQNSTDIWNDLGRIHEFSSEFLMKYGDKLSRINIESQRNITPEFVIQFQDNLGLGRLLENRERYGDVTEFLLTPEICGRYLNRVLSWKTSKEEVIRAVQNCRSLDDEARKQFEELVSSWYDTTIDIEKLIADYKDQDRAEYTEETVTGFWKNHSRKEKYINWEDYADECKRTGNDGLAGTWYKSFFRNPLLEILGYED